MGYTYDRRRIRRAGDYRSDADLLTSDELKEEVHKELQFLHKYIQGCQALVPIYRSLSEPLMEPQIGTYADHIEKRAKDVHTILELQSKVVSVADKLENEVYHFLVKVAKGEAKMKSGFPELIHDMPDGRTLVGLAREIEKTQSTIDQQEDGSHIDWTLEDFISGCGVFDHIDKLAPPAWEDEAKGCLLAYGFLNLMMNDDSGIEWLDQIREEEGVEE